MPATLTSGQQTWIVAKRLMVDRAYQRNRLSERKVRKIANEFDPDALGVIIVSHRADGTYFIIDGQHRVAAVKSLGWGDQKVPCYVHKGLTLEQEAKLFVAYNLLRTRPRPLEIHRANVEAHDDDAMGLEKVMADHGLRFGTGNGIGLVRGIASFQGVYKNAGPEVLSEALRVAKNAWGAGNGAFLGDNIYAIGLILARYNGRINSDRLTRVLSMEDPSRLITKARIVKAELGPLGGEGHRLAAILAQSILKLYNHRLPIDARVEWEDRPSVLFWLPVEQYEARLELRQEKRRKKATAA